MTFAIVLNAIFLPVPPWMRQAWLHIVSLATTPCLLWFLSALSFLVGLVRSCSPIMRWHLPCSGYSMLLRVGCGAGQDHVQQWVLPRTRKFFGTLRPHCAGPRFPSCCSRWSHSSAVPRGERRPRLGCVSRASDLQPEEALPPAMAVS